MGGSGSCGHDHGRIDLGLQRCHSHTTEAFAGIILSHPRFRELCALASSGSYNVLCRILSGRRSPWRLFREDWCRLRFSSLLTLCIFTAHRLQPCIVIGSAVQEILHRVFVHSFIPLQHTTNQICKRSPSRRQFTLILVAGAGVRAYPEDSTESALRVSKKVS